MVRRSTPFVPQGVPPPLTQYPGRQECLPLLPRVADDEFHVRCQRRIGDHCLGRGAGGGFARWSHRGAVRHAGAGKTRLVQAIAESLGVDRHNVVSPTFVLVQEHHGRRTIYHIDAYRLRDEDEFLALGPEEFFESDALVLIEWADRVLSCLPKDRVEIYIEVTGPHSRRFEVVFIGRRYAMVVSQLAELIQPAR